MKVWPFVLQTPHRFGVPGLFLVQEVNLSVGHLPYQLPASKIAGHLHKLLAIINELVLLLLGSLQVVVLAAATRNPSKDISATLSSLSSAQSCFDFHFRAFHRCGVSRA